MKNGTGNMSNEAILKRLDRFASFVKLIELNGESDGFHGVDREEGWEELVSQGDAALKEAGFEGDMFKDQPGGSYAYKTFYENGWQVGMDKRIAQVKEELIAKGWPDNQATHDIAWHTAMPTSDVEVMDEEDSKKPKEYEPVPDRKGPRYRQLEE